MVNKNVTAPVSKHTTGITRIREHGSLSPKKAMIRRPPVSTNPRMDIKNADLSSL